jgi:hypothetical protein
MPYVNGRVGKKIQTDTWKTQQEIQFCVIDWVTSLTGQHCKEQVKSRTTLM